MKGMEDHTQGVTPGKQLRKRRPVFLRGGSIDENGWNLLQHCAERKSGVIAGKPVLFFDALEVPLTGV
jgi:hypothetical protein